MKRNGFTLVELLVVIGVIAVLIGILVPALNKARQSSQRVACASNLRQIGICAFNYASNHKGYLPPRFREGYQDFTADSVYWLYLVQDIKQSGIPKYGLGLLYTMKYTTTEKIFYCANEPNSAFAHDTFKQPWLSDTSNNYRSSYMWNPHIAYRVQGNVGSGRITAYPKLTKFPKEKVLSMDVFLDNRISHYSGNEKLPSWNMLFADGHVQLVVSKLAYDSMKARGWALEGNAQAWTIFDDCRDILECEARGVNPRARPLVNRVPH